MTAKWRVGLACCLVLAVCLVGGVLSGEALPARSASAAVAAATATPPPSPTPIPSPVPTPGAVPRAGRSFRWYWQNPLPHPYEATGITCASAASCLALGWDGTAIRTSDGGRHWTAGTLGMGTAPGRVSCPTAAVCYAAGYMSTNSNTASYLLKSSDGGATWRGIRLNQPAESITCPNATTCLLTMTMSDGVHLLRTADGGHTLADVLPGGRGMAVSCPSPQVCYAGTDGSAGEHVIYRSEDAGRTWQAWSHSQVDGKSILRSLSCSSAGRCLAAFTKALAVIENGGQTWTATALLGNPRGRFASVTCIGGTACYALIAGKLYRSTDGGRTWPARALPIGLPIFAAACPAAGTCYLAAGWTVIKTGDAFGHTGETPAVSPIGAPALAAIQCPTRGTCYAWGGKSLVATANGGHTWIARPTLPLALTLACPGPSVCLGVGIDPVSGRPVIERTRDGALHWQRLAIPPDIQWLRGVSCPAIATCYITAETFGPATTTSSGSSVLHPRFALLVTHDGGTSWTVRRAIDRVPGHSFGHPGCTGWGCNIVRGDLGSLACPSVTTCFATIPTWSPAGSGWEVGTVVAATSDGGGNWSVVRQCPSSSAGSSYPSGCSALTCPGATSCYLIVTLPGAPNTPWNPRYQLLATRNGGASWHSALSGAPLYDATIACATASACRVLVPTGGTRSLVFITADGGKTWRVQRTPAPVSAIDCPSADSCYAVGGMAILATRRP